jgi:hypothetical protein
MIVISIFKSNNQHEISLLMELQVMIIISILENIDCQSDFTDAWIASYNNDKHFQQELLKKFTDVGKQLMVMMSIC